MKMTTMLLAACAAAVTAYGAGTCCNAPYPETIDEGFVPLFNGRDLSGWCGATEMYGVETITETMRGTKQEKTSTVLACFPERHVKGSSGNLCTEKEYRNFILRFEFKMPENGNNGLGIRMVDVNKDAAYFGMCELQLLDDGGSQYYDGEAKKDKLKPYQYTGSVYGIVPALRDNVGKQIWGKEKNFAAGGSYLRRAGLWNFEEVKVIGSEIEVYLNGILITKADVSKWKGDGDTPDGKKHPGLHTPKGRIGWLGHGHHVMWRNIRIKELPDDAKMGVVCPCCPCQTAKCPAGFTTYFAGKACDLANWKGVTTTEKFDNPKVRQAATPEKRAEMQKVADKGMAEHSRAATRSPRRRTTRTSRCGSTGASCPCRATAASISAARRKCRSGMPTTTGALARAASTTTRRTPTRRSASQTGRWATGTASTSRWWARR